MSHMGHSRLGRTNSNSGHVRLAPSGSLIGKKRSGARLCAGRAREDEADYAAKATVNCLRATCSDEPKANIPPFTQRMATMD